jgi:hypothetical protein
MKTIEQSIEINAPAQVVFEQISNFRLFPQWLHGIGRVRLISPTRALWATETASGEGVEWETETGVFDPDRRIAWHSMGGDLLAEGEALLEETGGQTTLLRFSLSYDETSSSPEGVADYLLGDDPEQQLHDSLVRLQQLAERAAEYGAAGQFPQTVATPTFLSSLPKPISRARPLDAPAAEEAYVEGDAHELAGAGGEGRVSDDVPPTAGELPRATALPPATPPPAPPSEAAGSAASRESFAAVNEVDEVEAAADSRAAGARGAYLYVRRSPVAGYVIFAVLGLLAVGVIAALVSRGREDSPSAQVVLPTATPESTRRAPAAAATPAASPTITPQATPSPAPTSDEDDKATPASPEPPAASDSAATADEAPEPPPAPAPVDEGVERAVVDTVGRWVDATNARDVGWQMSFYSPVLRRYYLKGGVGRAAVRADKEARFADADEVNIQAGKPEISFEDEGRTARVRFRKQYKIAGREKDERGEVLQELVLARRGGEWKIVSERDLRVLK